MTENDTNLKRLVEEAELAASSLRRKNYRAATRARLFDLMRNPILYFVTLYALTVILFGSAAFIKGGLADCFIVLAIGSGIAAFFIILANID